MFFKSIYTQIEYKKPHSYLWCGDGVNIYVMSESNVNDGVNFCKDNRKKLIIFSLFVELLSYFFQCILIQMHDYFCSILLI